MSLDPRLEKYFRSYDSKSFDVVACQGNEPSEADVAAFEETIGFRLPDDFRAFTRSPLGGLYIQVKPSIWPPPEQYAVGPFWTFLRGVMVFGIAKGIPDWLDLRVQYEELAADGHPEWVPFLALESSADRFCFQRDGAIVEWSHEEPDDPRPVKGTFVDLLLRELAELEDRKKRRVSS